MQFWKDLYDKETRPHGRTVERKLTDIGISSCYACSAKSLWFEGQLVFPATTAEFSVPAELPSELSRDFEEAAAIAHVSPRAASALLRMCIEGLCKTVTGKSKFDAAIKALEQQGIPDEIAAAMDVVRLTGNEALHAGQLYGADDAKTVAILFRLATLIVKWAITERRELRELIESIPKEKLEHRRKQRGRAGLAQGT